MKNVRELINNNSYVSLRVEAETIAEIVSKYIGYMYQNYYVKVVFSENEDSRLDFTLLNKIDLPGDYTQNNKLYNTIENDYDYIASFCEEAIAEDLGIEDSSKIGLIWDGDSSRLRLEIPAEEYLKIKNNQKCWSVSFKCPSCKYEYEERHTDNGYEIIKGDKEFIDIYTGNSVMVDNLEECTPGDCNYEDKVKADLKACPKCNTVILYMN